MEIRDFYSKQNLSEEIVRIIKQGILDGLWNPGDRIIETKLAKDLGISQTPVREAIRQLVGEGIVTNLPNKGTIVRDFKVKDVFEIYSTRAMVEGMAIRLAIKNATLSDIHLLEDHLDQMKKKVTNDSVASLSKDAVFIHERICQLSNHSMLQSMYDSISFKINQLNRMIMLNYTKEEEVKHHEGLVEHLKNGDPDTAENEIRNHIRFAYFKFIKFSKIETDGWDINFWP